MAVDPIALDETLNKAFWQILDATYYDGTIVMLDKTSTKTLRLKDKTARFYRELRRQQPGSFLLFPGQFGFHYRGRELSDVEISMYNQELLVCPAVGACMILNHPSRFKMYSPSLLNIKFGGAHCHDHNCVLISRNHITYRGSRRIELRHSHDNKLDAYGVVTGFLP